MYIGKFLVGVIVEPVIIVELVGPCFARAFLPKNSQNRKGPSTASVNKVAARSFLA
jgi:hypothetical protein